MINRMLGWTDLIEKNLLNEVDKQPEKIVVPGRVDSTPIAR